MIEQSDEPTVSIIAVVALDGKLAVLVTVDREDLAGVVVGA